MNKFNVMGKELYYHWCPISIKVPLSLIRHFNTTQLRAIYFCKCSCCMRMTQLMQDDTKKSFWWGIVGYTAGFIGALGMVLSAGSAQALSRYGITSIS